MNKVKPKAKSVPPKGRIVNLKIIPTKKRTIETINRILFFISIRDY
jgi:hypothetical protein